MLFGSSLVSLLFQFGYRDPALGAGAHPPPGGGVYLHKSLALFFDKYCWQ